MILPWPFSKASVIPSTPLIIPPVGKSGPLTISLSSENDAFGFLINLIVAFKISVKLWGGISVANPAAIPFEPLINKLGIRDGKTIGSYSLSSKLGAIGTTLRSKSLNKSSEIFSSLDSV